jgi:hypothetical protein
LQGKVEGVGEDVREDADLVSGVGRG